MSIVSINGLGITGTMSNGMPGPDVDDLEEDENAEELKSSSVAATVASASSEVRLCFCCRRSRFDDDHSFTCLFAKTRGFVNINGFF